MQIGLQVCALESCCTDLQWSLSGVRDTDSDSSILAVACTDGMQLCTQGDSDAVGHFV